MGSTFILAVGQTFAYGFQAYQIYSDPEFSDLASSFVLFCCTFLSFTGLYGVYGVFKKNPVFVRLFSRWFLYELVASVFGVFFVAFSFLSRRDELCQGFYQSATEESRCLEDFPVVLATFIAIFILGAMIRLHYFFSIRSYARRLETEEQRSNALTVTKVVYPQYVYVAADEKSSLA